MNGPGLRPVAIEATLSVTLFVLVPIGLVESDAERPARTTRPSTW
jgi:hypothetical protein